MSAESPWYSRMFGTRYIRVYEAKLSAERTRAEVDFLEKALELQAGMQVLDAPCGHGRHLVELASRGYSLTGVDLEPEALEHAWRAAQLRGVADQRVTLRRVDLREMPFVEAFDAAYNYFTSFGYLETEHEDERALHAIACALRPGGRFVLETPNIYHLAQVFEDASGWEAGADGYAIEIDRRWDLLAGILHERRNFRDPQGHVETVDVDLRLYSPASWQEILTASD